MSPSYGSQYPSGYPTSGQGQSSPGYYYPVPQQASYSPYPGAHPSSSGMPARPSTYPQPGSTPYAEERASKRRRPASMDPNTAAQMQAQRAGQSSDPRYAGPSAAAYGHGHAQGQMMHRPSSTARRSSPSNTHSRRGSDEPEDDEEEPLDHGPTEFPPRTYQGQSKYNPPKKPGKIPGSAMDYLPILEARFDRLETAIDRYVEHRGQRALSNSILPGSSSSQQQGHSSRR